jgi:outer membrane protein TolC
MKPLILGRQFASIASMILVITSINSYAQNLPPYQTGQSNYEPINLSNYLDELVQNSPSLRIKELGAKSATSTANQAGRPNLNPILTYARGSIYTQAPYTGYTNPSSNTIGATVTIEGWGKRSAREAQAQAELNRIIADGLSERRSIETQAIFTYIDALRTKLLWQSYQGAIDQISNYRTNDATQIKSDFIDAQRVLNNDLKFYSLSLVNFIGNPDKGLPLPLGTLNIPTQSFNTEELISNALEKREDLKLVKASINSANANLDVIKAGKSPDFLPGVYYTETPPYDTSGTNYGTQKSFSFLLSVPLGNGLINNSDVLAGSNAVIEQEINLASSKTKIYTEINQTYLQYEASKLRLNNAIKAYSKAKTETKQNIMDITRLREAEYELIDARTVHAKTLILLKRLSGDFEVPNLY